MFINSAVPHAEQHTIKNTGKCPWLHESAYANKRKNEYRNDAQRFRHLKEAPGYNNAKIYFLFAVQIQPYAVKPYL
jgi:hypothetical protein